MKFNTLKFLTTTSFACLLVACGGGGSSTYNSSSSATGNSSSIVTYGTITGFGSVFVNGVRFDVSGAQVTDNSQAATADDLEVGEMVRLEAQDHHDGGLPRALHIERDSAVEGDVTAVDTTAGTFTILGQLIVVDSSTMFDNRISPTSLAGIAVGMHIEVDGFIAADGSIHATRVQPNKFAADNEVTGTVASLDTTLKTFKIGTLTVNYATAAMRSFPSSGPANGDLVEARGTTIDSSGGLVATVVARMHFDDDTMRSADEVEFEGLVTRFVSATDFDVNNKAVTTTSSTVYRGGTSSSLALNVKVEVEGKLNSGGVLVADKISFRQEADVRIDGNIESIDATAGTLKMLGITVKVDTTTIFDDKSGSHDHFIALSKLAVGDHVQVRGVVDATVANQVDATRLERESGSATTVELRGAISALAQPNFTILGTTVVTNSSTTFKDISASNLFASTTMPLVDVRGTWDGTNLTAKTVQLQTEEEMHD